MIYYVSFVSNDRFLGGTFVEADNEYEVIPTCWLHNVNPGGEALIVGAIPDDEFVRIMPNGIELYKLYTKEELEELDRRTE